MSADNKQYMLRFLAGKYQGATFPLGEKAQYVIGRDTDKDLYLDDELVSRQHALLLMMQGQVVIQDQSSTNGTLVNGKRVDEKVVQAGDTVLIGTNIMRLEKQDPDAVPAAAADTQDARDQLEEVGKEQSAVTMSGNLGEIPVPDLLQMFSTMRKSGDLILKHQKQTGIIYLRSGQVVFARIEGALIPPIKAFIRMVSWRTGHFELQAASEQTFSEELQESIEGLLMEAMRVIDEIERIKENFPNEQEAFEPIKPLEQPLRSLTDVQLDVFQVVLNEGLKQNIFDKSSLSDLETYEALKFLIDHKYIA